MDEEMKSEELKTQDKTCKHVHHHGGGGAAGGLWFAGWLFFLAFTQPIWWKALLGLIIWPFYLGVALR